MGLDQYLYRCNEVFHPENTQYDGFYEWCNGQTVYDEMLDLSQKYNAHGKEIWYGRKCYSIDRIIVHELNTKAVHYSAEDIEEDNIPDQIYHLTKNDMIQLESVIVNMLQAFNLFRKSFNNNMQVTASDIAYVLTHKNIIEPIAELRDYNDIDLSRIIVNPYILIRLGNIKSKQKYRNMSLTEFVDKLDTLPEYTSQFIPFISYEEAEYERKLNSREKVQLSTINNKAFDGSWYSGIDWEYSQIIYMFIAVHNELSNKYSNKLEWYYFRSY